MNRNRLLAAAVALEADSGGHPDVQALLRYLDYADSDAALRPSRARLLRAAAKFRCLFPLQVPDAPGLIFLGGEADPACLGAAYAGQSIGNIAGSGVTPQRAFEACAGEGIEYLSQFAQHGDDIEIDTPRVRCGRLDRGSAGCVAALLAECHVDRDKPIGWVRVRRLPAGPDSWMPADICLRREAAQRDLVAPLKLSSGCAADVTKEGAALRAVLELVERDAAALWWRGGQRGRAVAPDSEAGHAAAALLEELRQGGQERRTWLLDITTDLQIPAIAAVSVRKDGRGFAFGLAARLSAADAARAAIFEMCQSELAHHVVAAKQREAGSAALNDNDRRRLQHGELIDARRCLLLQPQGDSRLPPSPIAAGLPDILARLAAHGITAYRLDLTRPMFQVPVVRVLAPGLQAEPCPIVGERLARAIDATGGGAVHTGGVSLL